MTSAEEPPPQTTLPRSRMSLRELLAEAVNGVLERPTRSALTAVGTLLGVGMLVAVLGLTSSAAAQIGKRFDPVTATEVSLVDPGDGVQVRSYGFLPDAEQRVRALNGVTAAGISWSIQQGTVITSMPPVRTSARGNVTPLVAASPGVFEQAAAQWAGGRPYTSWEDRTAQRVAVLGPTIARQLGISHLQTGHRVWLDGVSFEVVGVLSTTQRRAEMLSAVVIPDLTARHLYGSAGGGAYTMWTVVAPGAAEVVAQELPLAVNPDLADRFQVAKPPDPRSLRVGVDQDLRTLLLGLSGVCLLVGMVGIANTTFVSVMERTSEIGLRRALGARRRHILGQFLTEAMLIGFFGGLLGSSLAVLVVLGTCLAKGWTAVLDPSVALLGPLAGLVVGGLAGAYPAWRASRIEPMEAMRAA